jgi:hypothetical protein
MPGLSRRRRGFESRRGYTSLAWAYAQARGVSRVRRGMGCGMAVAAGIACLHVDAGIAATSNLPSGSSRAIVSTGTDPLRRAPPRWRSRGCRARTRDGPAQQLDGRPHIVVNGPYKRAVRRPEVVELRAGCGYPAIRLILQASGVSPPWALVGPFEQLAHVPATEQARRSRAVGPQGSTRHSGPSAQQLPSLRTTSDDSRS